MKIRDILEFAPMSQSFQQRDRQTPPQNDAERAYAPEFVQRVKALAAEPPAKSMSGEEAVAHYARLLAQGTNGR